MAVPPGAILVNVEGSAHVVADRRAQLDSVELTDDIILRGAYVEVVSSFSARTGATMLGDSAAREI